MQLKLLNFHKMLANFSISLVGGFIPLMIYKATLNIVYAIGYLILLYIFNITFNLIFQKAITKYPQIFLIVRAVPILGLSLSILLIDVNWIWGSILIAIFYAFNNSFKSNANEIILNYSTGESDGKGLGLTRVFEQIGTIVAQVLGGLFLDYLSLYVLIIIAIAIYLVSCIPLLSYYLKSRKQKGFNAEKVSNAVISFKERSDKTSQGKKVSKNLILQYGFVYYLIAFLDIMMDMFRLFMFVEYGQFALAGYFSAVYNGTYAIASYVNGYLANRFDMTLFACVGVAINGVCCILLPFAGNLVLWFILIGLIGFCYPFYSIFVLDRMLTKSRILGVSNNAIFIRDNATVLGKMWGLVFGLFGSFIPIFIAMGGALIACSPTIYENEEITRENMINYLEGNN